ncbi:hypothetical protein CBL_20689 [Carabus blaptoides fortunei]
MFDALEADKEITLHEFWRNYNIADAIQNINKGWNDLRNTTMNAAWKNIWPNCVSSSTNDTSSLQTVDNDIAEIVALGRQFIDPDSERRGTINRGLKAQIAPYELILQERRRAAEQPTLDRFFKTATSKTTTTTATVEESSSESDYE